MTLAVGLRVVRGPDWEWEQQDGGKGFVGTVVRGSEGLGAVVQWDCGVRGKYRCGLRGKCDLRVLDSGPTGLYFSGVYCYGCQVKGISGYQWKCMACPDYQLCSTCYMSDCHSLHHRFKCIIDKKGLGYRMMSRFKFRRRVAKGLFPGATVTRGHDWRWKDQDGGPGSVGELIKITDWKEESYRSVAEVNWNLTTRDKNVYRIGHKGKVDVKFASPGEGPLVYMDHLPVLGGCVQQRGERDFMSGDRVKCELDVESVRHNVGSEQELASVISLMLDSCGVVTREILLTGEYTVRYPNNTLVAVHPAAITLMPGSSHKEGDVVRMLDDMNHIYKLQDGHGEWRDDMALCLGQVGVVRKMKPNGDIMVQFEKHEWILNPACVDPAPDATPPEFSGVRNFGIEDDGFIMRLLGEASANISLLHAVKSGDEEKVKFYLDSHPDLLNETMRGHTALEIAINECNNKIVSILVKDYKADVEKPNEEMKRPLHISAQCDNPEAAKILLDSGADVNAPGPNGVTPVMIASALDNIRTLHVLVSHSSVNLEARDRHDSVALLHSIRCHRSMSATALLEHGADPLAVCNTKTCLHDAGFHDNLPIMEEMVRRCPEGLDKAMLLGGHTPLHLAAIRNSYSVVEFLCRHPCCSINAREGEGRTALHCAAIEGSSDVIEMLVGYGADVNMEDPVGNSALHLVLFKKVGCPPNEILSPGITKVKLKLRRMLGVEPVAPNYMVLACFLAQERSSIVKKSQIFNKTPLELCPLEYRDVLRNFVNKPGNFSGRLKRRGSKVKTDSSKIQSFRHQSSSTIRQRDREALGTTAITSRLASLSSLSSAARATSSKTTSLPPAPNATPTPLQFNSLPTPSPLLRSLASSLPSHASPVLASHSQTTPPSTSTDMLSSPPVSVDTHSVLPVTLSVPQVSHLSAVSTKSSMSTSNSSTSVSSDKLTVAVSSSSTSSDKAPISISTHHPLPSLVTATANTTTTTTTTTTITSTSFSSSMSVNELNSAPSNPVVMIPSKPLTVKNSLSIPVKNYDSRSLDAKKKYVSLVEKPNSVSDAVQGKEVKSVDSKTALLAPQSDSGYLSSSGSQQRSQPTLLPPNLVNERSSLAGQTSSQSPPPLCIVCEDVCDIKLHPCGHVLVCSECGRRMKKCPACKMVVEKKLAV